MFNWKHDARYIIFVLELGRSYLHTISLWYFLVFKSHYTLRFITLELATRFEFILAQELILLACSEKLCDILYVCDMHSWICLTILLWFLLWTIAMNKIIYLFEIKNIIISVGNERSIYLYLLTDFIVIQLKKNKQFLNFINKIKLYVNI